ncbi:MAG: S-adenosylmethionine:tRNA ribosyltransferase-isomerase, partial [Bacteroidales bacterium]|nr:S-adenosylmethionine:tRNA ribosyltransferase-isomerase [Bacteroidales bacterium]
MRPKIKIADFDYSLPQERIAKFPLENRSASKLLVYDFGRLFSGENRLENKINNINSNIINCSNNNKIL